MRILAEYEQSGRRVTFDVESVTPPVGSFEVPSAVIFEVAPGSQGASGGVFLQLNRFEKSAGPEDAVDHMRCVGDTLVQERMTWDTDRFERFDPPLPWLQLPLEQGASWSWEGRITFDNEEPSESRGFAARASFSVGERRLVDTPVGAIEAMPVEYTFEMLTGPDAPRPSSPISTLKVTSWFSPDRYLIVKRTRENVGIAGGFEERWTLRSVVTQD